MDMFVSPAARAALREGMTTAFGGGAHVLDLATHITAAWIDTNGWLARTLTPGRGKRGA